MKETLPPPPLAFDPSHGDEDGYSLLVCLKTGVQSLPLRRDGRQTVGRAETNDVVVPHSSVSREHAIIYSAGGTHPTIEDARSRNGTRVGGHPVTPGQRVQLLPGSSVEIGSVSMFVHRGAPLQTRPIPVLPKTPRAGSSRLILRDSAMIELLRLAEIVAQSDLRVLILGETGVGKELLTEAVHNFSQRRAGPLVRFNCSAFPETLLESELFGHERGAFTGATQNKVGLFQSAEGGTLFLDEVGELSLATQAKLLRVLETREVTRLGSTKPVSVDVRFIAATNRDLQEMIRMQAFRADLFFRLNGMSLTIPPLRKRKAEIAPLATHFATEFAATLGRPKPEFTPAAIHALETYGWFGNVRELKNVIERTVLLSPTSVIEASSLGIDVDNKRFASDLSPPPSQNVNSSTFIGARAAEDWSPEMTLSGTRAIGGGSDPNTFELRAELVRRERQQIVEALGQAGTQAEAAKLLGISRRTLINRLEEYGIERPRKRK